MKKRIAHVVVAALCVVLLSGCKTHVDLSISEDDTYTLAVEIDVPKNERSDYSCDEFRQDLGQAAESDQVKITDKSTKVSTRCTMEFTVQQPISNTKAPFVEIRRNGDIFNVKLAPIKDLEMTANQEIDFRLTVFFPGSVIGASGGDKAKIVGSTVTWTTPEVLYKGFSAEGWAYAGIAIWKRALIVFAFFILINVVVFTVFKDTRTIKQIRAWVKQTDARIGSPVAKVWGGIKNVYYFFADRIYILFHRDS